jgi:hypothetical protein
MTSIFRFAFTAIVAACVLNGQPSTAGNAIVLAGGGYQTPSPGLAVAPGQIVVVHVHGIATTIESDIVAVAGPSGLPHTLGGISVDLIQGANGTATSLGLIAIFQTRCVDPCSPVTGITLQIPFDLPMDSIALPSLRISENGKPAGGVLLLPVTDNVHVINTCDDSRIFISAAYSVPQNVCASDVMHGGFLNSLYNIAHGGDQAAVWLYGMGAKTEQPANCCSSPDQLSKPVQSFLLNFDFRPNAPAVPAVPGFGLTAAPLFAAYVGGPYQVNFAIPPVPAGLPACDGVRIKSNLTVTITGPNSYDAAKICVAP